MQKNDKDMKTKILSILFLALLLCSSAFAGDKFEDKGITYEIYETTTDNGNVTGSKVRVVAGAEKYSGDIIIPEKVTYKDVDYTVCEIGNNAFDQCTGLTSIKLPNSVTTIEQSAFSTCTNLSSVELSDALVSIGKYAFSNCTKLERITLPNSLQEIKDNAFSNSGLKTIVSEIESPFAINKNVFNNYDKAALYVKEGLVPVYKETDGWKEFVNIQEIPSNVRFTANDNGTSFTYSLKPLYKTGAITEFNSVNHDITIPEKVTYNNQEYVIESINDGVFAHKDIVTITFPQKIQTLGEGMFTGSQKLSAIIWNRTDRPSDELTSSIENPNVLFYVKSEDAAPSNLTNVIVNNVAKNIVLEDAPESNFYCPQKFTAENISYTHNYSLKTEKGVVQGWESIALPFDVQKYETTDGVAKPYAAAASGEKLFWLRELTDAGFKEAAGIKANIPYIISMPNWDGYQPFYNIEGDVTFSATDAVVPKTEVKGIVYGNKTFWPSYSTIKAQNEIYVLNRETIDDNAPGSIFVKDNRKTNPFECYFTYSGTANARAINICDMMDGATDIAPICVKPNVHVRNGIIFIDSTIADVLNIYNLSGKCIKSVKLNKGHNIINGLSNGTYIIGNQKIILTK